MEEVYYIYFIRCQLLLRTPIQSEESIDVHEQTGKASNGHSLESDSALNDKYTFVLTIYTVLNRSQ